MSFLSEIRGTGIVDLKQLQRQSFLVYLILLPLLSGMLIRTILPLAAERFVDSLQLETYYPLLVSALLVVLTPTLMGTVIGFLLLDERDDQTLTALLVTPLPLYRYLLYRLAVPTLLSLILTVLAVWICGLVTINSVSLIVISLEAAAAAPIVALVYFCFSENKVQGFGVLKILGAITFALPIGAYFIGMPAQYGFGVFPLYWSAKAFWLACDESNWVGLPLLIGACYKLGLIKILIDRFYSVVYR